jgi:hypothetical protein
MPPIEAEKWLDHLTSCSPCYRDFSQLQNAQELRRKRTWLAIAASVLICAAIGGWAFIHWHNGTQTVQTATVDLRDWSVARGAEPNPNLPPIELIRKRRHKRFCFQWVARQESMKSALSRAQEIPF